MSLLFNMLSRFVIAFLSRSKHLLISWLQSPSAVILEPNKINSVTVSSFSLFFPFPPAQEGSPSVLGEILLLSCFHLPGHSAPTRTLLLAHLAPGLRMHYCSLNTTRTHVPQGLCICCHHPQEWPSLQKPMWFNPVSPASPRGLSDHANTLFYPKTQVYLMPSPCLIYVHSNQHHLTCDTFIWLFISYPPPLQYELHNGKSVLCYIPSA